eukprot:g68261.t1
MTTPKPLTMGEPEELADGVGELNLNPTPAPAGFWKPWGEVEEKAPAEMKNPRLVRGVLCLRIDCAGDSEGMLKIHRNAVENLQKFLTSCGVSTTLVLEFLLSH